jgi:hypothetical protein
MMMDLLVFVRQDAPLRRIEEVAKEVAAAGLEVTVSSPSLSVVAGRTASRDVIARLRAIKDVVAVREPQQR